MKHLIAFAKQYGPVFVLIGLTLTMARTGTKVVWLLAGISSKVDAAVATIESIKQSVGSIGEEVRTFKDKTTEEINGLKQRTSILEERSNNRDRKKDLMLVEP